MVVVQHPPCRVTTVGHALFDRAGITGNNANGAPNLTASASQRTGRGYAQVSGAARTLADAIDHFLTLTHDGCQQDPLAAAPDLDTLAHNWDRSLKRLALDR